MLIALVIAFIITSCGSGIPTPVVSPLTSEHDPQTGLTLPVGWTVSVLYSGLTQPTHAAFAPDGTLYVTQLNGDENAGLGQVLRLHEGQTPEVVIDKLNKPTGLTWADGALYIVAREFVLATRPNTDGSFPPPQRVTEALPFNGRSNGQIFTGPDGALYFQSTGNENDPENSGLILTAKAGEAPLKVERAARGLKNAYALAWNPVTGQLYTTDIGDGNIAGYGQPPEELNVVHRGSNFGWPRCYGNQLENAQFGGERVYCSDTDVPLAMFPARSTPSGLAFFDGKLIVALYGLQKLVSVDPNSGAVGEFASGFKHPVALTVTPDRQAMLVVDIDAGIIYRFFKQ
ncbi:MAG: PQQ-dependent sugar dehydrogenase [Anaerolineae bacterium]|nr:PQQ-dependent sugar dehydrogenase [Anaerolineae bacterium]